MTPAPDAAARAPADAPPEVLPVVAKHLEVRREVETTGSVRVTVAPRARTVPVEFDAAGESVEIERVPVGRVVERAEEPRREGDTWIVPVYEERLVTERRLVLVEEVRLHRRPWQRSWREDVVLRHDEVRVERTARSPPPADDPRSSPVHGAAVDPHP